MYRIFFCFFDFFCFFVFHLLNRFASSVGLQACKQKLIDISKELREAHEAFEALSLNHSIAVVETARPEAERQASEAAEQLHKDLAMQHEEDKLV